MIKKLRVTVDGKPYEVTVELSDDQDSGAPPPTMSTPPVVSAPAPKTAPPPPPPVSVASAPASPSGPGSVVSPLTGLVVQIALKVGEQVNEGDKVFTLEAMKMNTVVVAPKSGKVAEIKVGVGDAVTEGQVLAVIS
jgi:biotin carboxyl carrier protein